MLRAGLIGLGMMGKNHARILENLEGVELVGICDSNSNLESFYRNVKVFVDLKDLISQGIDYAVVAVPTTLHFQISKILSDSGIHALIEKPLSYDLESSEAICKLFTENSLIGAVGHIERFNPAVIEAKKRMSQLGRILQVSTIRQGPFSNRISDVGVVKDLATHDIDLVTWMTGSNYLKVFAHTSNKLGRKHEDMIVAIARLNNGAIVNHVVNWVSPTKERSISIVGENGMFKIDTLLGDLTFYENGETRTNWSEVATFRGVSEGNLLRYALHKVEPLLVEHQNFRDAVLGRKHNSVSLQEGCNALRVADEMLRDDYQMG
jgi:predicted dehydrogenase